ncbi:MAG: hypothetical protein WBC60_12155 [Cognaticolwellia sp.]
MATFDANVIFLILVLTTTASILYLLVLSYIITQMDTRYFVRKPLIAKNIPVKNVSKSQPISLVNSSVSLVVHIAKIIIGLSLLLCGILMLVLPGQGLITMLIGLSLLPFPGKDKLENNLLGRKAVRTSLNWIRVKANKEPFIFD